jgi:hypothetical protein
MAAGNRPVASACAGWAKWNAIFSLALVAACPARGIIVVPCVVVIYGHVRPSGLRGRRWGGRGPRLRIGRPGPRVTPDAARPSPGRSAAAAQGVLELLLTFLAERGLENGAAVLAERVDNPVRGGLVHHEEQCRRAGLQQVADLLLKVIVDPRLKDLSLIG